MFIYIRGWIIIMVCLYMLDLYGVLICMSDWMYVLVWYEVRYFNFYVVRRIEEKNIMCDNIMKNYFLFFGFFIRILWVFSKYDVL